MQHWSRSGSPAQLARPAPLRSAEWLDGEHLTHPTPIQFPVQFARYTAASTIDLIAHQPTLLSEGGIGQSDIPDRSLLSPSLIIPFLFCYFDT